MKVLLVATLDSTHTIRWANGLQGRGHQVIVFSTRSPLPGLSKAVKTVVRPRFGKMAYLLYGWALRRKVRTERPNVVHVMYASGFGLLASTWLHKGSYVLSMLGSDIFDFPKTRVRRCILKRNLSHAGVLLSTSKTMRREARQYTAAPIRLTPFGVDVDVFRPNACRPAKSSPCRTPLRIGTARLLEPKYGIDTLIEAIALLKRRGVAAVDLQIAGEGSEKAKLMTLASRLGLADNIRFLGWLPHGQMPQFLRGLDIFCALSRLESESFCVAALEASACGLPVVASRIGGLPETVVDGETGILVAPGSPQDAANGLQRLCEDDALRARLGGAGRKHVRQRYDWRHSLDAMEQVYGDLGPAHRTCADDAKLPPVSVIVPVRNADATLPATLRSVLEQTYKGEIEVIVADGNRPPTAERICRPFPRVRVVVNPAGTTPAGLNVALGAAKHDVIVRCDGHSTLPPDYIAAAVQALRRTGAANVGGKQVPIGTTSFERAVALATTSPLGAGDARYRLGGAEGPADTVYLGVFRADALRAAGGFNEALIRNQDYELNWRLRERGEAVWFDPKLAAEYRPRGSVAALARQYFEYGLWKRAVLRLHPRSLRLRQLAAPALLVLLGVAALLALAGLFADGLSPGKAALLAAAAVVPLGYAGLLFAGSAAIGLRRRTTLAWRLPLIFATIHFAWGAGFLVSRKRIACSAAANDDSASSV